MADPKEETRRSIEMFNQGKFDEWAERFADDIELVTPMAGRLKGKEAAKAYFAQTHGSFPGLQVNPSKIVADGDTVVVEYTVTGTNKGPTHMPTGETIPPTNKTITIASLDISTLDANGKVKSLHQYFDVAGALQQLGLVPAPAAARS